MYMCVMSPSMKHSCDRKRHSQKKKKTDRWQFGDWQAVWGHPFARQRDLHANQVRGKKVPKSTNINMIHNFIHKICISTMISQLTLPSSYSRLNKKTHACPFNVRRCRCYPTYIAKISPTHMGLCTIFSCSHSKEVLFFPWDFCHELHVCVHSFVRYIT